MINGKKIIIVYSDGPIQLQVNLSNLQYLFMLRDSIYQFIKLLNKIVNIIVNILKIDRKKNLFHYSYYLNVNRHSLSILDFLLFAFTLYFSSFIFVIYDMLTSILSLIFTRIVRCCFFCFADYKRIVWVRTFSKIK